MIADNRLVRDHNTSLILKEILLSVSVSRIELAQRTELNKATVTRIVDELLKRKIVAETESVLRPGQKGRPAVMISVPGESGYCISCEISNRLFRFACIDASGKVIRIQRLETDSNDYSRFLERITSLVREIAAERGMPPFALCVGVHGTVSLEGRIRFAPSLLWKDRDLSGDLSARFDCPVFVENEANLCAKAEYCYGGHARSEDLFSLSFGTGIGLGIIHDGSVFRGGDGFAGEIGHLVIHPDGLPCSCGNRGCFEQYCSEFAIQHRLGLEKTSKEPFDPLSAADVISAPESASRDASGIDGIAADFAVGINSLVMLFNPKHMILNSSVLRQIPDFLAKLKSNLTSAVNGDWDIRFSKLADKACVLGGGTLCLEQFYGTEQLRINS